jgi:hypothetical protein
MTRLAVRLFAGLLLIGVGWALAQTSTPDFELIVEAPGGETTIECARACNLVWVERGNPVGALPQSRFRYSCTGGRCSSGRIGGWITR